MELAVTAEVDHRDPPPPAARARDLVATRDIAEQLVSMGVNGRLVSLDNMVDKAAMKENSPSPCASWAHSNPL